MANRETSDELSSLAGKVLNEQPRDGDENLAFNALLVQAKKLAGSVLSQDEHKGPRPSSAKPEENDPVDLIERSLMDFLCQGGGDAETLRAHAETMWEELRSLPGAGSTAYELIAATETRNVEVTETLIHMTAATVLAKLIDEEGAGRLNISFSPQDMDEMNRRYDLEATHDGMLTTVHITPRPGMFPKGAQVHTQRQEDGIEITRSRDIDDEAEEHPPESLYREDGVDDTPAEAQAAEHTYDRPLWAARIDGKLFPASDREQAEKMMQGLKVDQIGQVENRFCYHDDCPAERCNVDPKPELGDDFFEEADAYEGDKLIRKGTAAKK